MFKCLREGGREVEHKKEEREKMEKEEEGEFPSAGAHNSQGWVWLKLGARYTIQVSPLGDKTPVG